MLTPSAPATRDEHGFIIPKRAYVLSHDDGETTYAYAIFSRASVAEELSEASYGQYGYDHEELAAALTGWTAFDRGPGRAFGASPSVRVGKVNVVVRQMCGLDV